VRACVGALIDAGIVWGGGDAWRTGGRLSGVRQRRRLARVQGPRLGGAGPQGRGGDGEAVVFGLRRGRACVHMHGR
jgi:hypothetical protein